MVSDWQSLDSEGLVLGKVSPLFLKKNVPTLYRCLVQLAEHLSTNLRNLKAFYKLLFLLALEFSQPGVLDLVLCLNQLQLLALGSVARLSAGLCTALHAIIAGLLYLMSRIALAPALQEHIEQVLERRKVSAPYLLPAAVFASENRDDDSTSNSSSSSLEVDKSLLFTLDGELLRKSPEPKRSFSK